MGGNCVQEHLNVPSFLQSGFLRGPNNVLVTNPYRVLPIKMSPKLFISLKRNDDYKNCFRSSFMYGIYL